MNGYVALFGDRRIEIQAESLYAAKLEAVKVFKPAKSKQHLISVVLAEKDGQPVTHTAD